MFHTQIGRGSEMPWADVNPKGEHKAPLLHDTFVDFIGPQVDRNGDLLYIYSFITVLW